MPKKQEREISVVTVFDDKKDTRQAFVELILHKYYVDNSGPLPVDDPLIEKYNQDRVLLVERVR